MSSHNIYFCEEIRNIRKLIDKNALEYFRLDMVTCFMSVNLHASRFVCVEILRPSQS